MSKNTVKNTVFLEPGNPKSHVFLELQLIEGIEGNALGIFEKLKNRQQGTWEKLGNKPGKKPGNKHCQNLLMNLVFIPKAWKNLVLNDPCPLCYDVTDSLVSSEHHPWDRLPS